jgi:hypothetical protein
MRRPIPVLVVAYRATIEVFRGSFVVIFTIDCMEYPISPAAILSLDFREVLWPAELGFFEARYDYCEIPKSHDASKVSLALIVEAVVHNFWLYELSFT